MKFIRHLAAVLLIVAAICIAAMLCFGSATVGGPAHGNRVIFERQVPNGTIIGPDGNPIPSAELQALRVRGPGGSTGFRLDIGNLTDTTIIALLIAAVVVAGSATRHTIRRRSRRRPPPESAGTAVASRVGLDEHHG